MIPCTGSVHAQALLRVGTVGFWYTQTIYRKSTTCRAGELGIVIEMHAASQHHVTLLFERHGFHDVIDIFCLQLLGRHTKAIATRNDHSRQY